MFAAVLDTCVLWPSLQRDFLMSLAIENLYRPLWSSEILGELEYHEARKLHQKRGLPMHDAEVIAARLIMRMRVNFNDAEVVDWEPHVGRFGLPDPDDEHVLAAAVAGHAGAIVTENFRDFPADKVPPGIEVIGPAEFAANTVAVAPDLALHAVAEMSRRRRNPPESVELLLDALVSMYKMSEAVEFIREAQ